MMKCATCLVLWLAFAATASGQATAPISAEQLSRVTQVLASDEFEGRAPGTPGEDRTIAYLVEQFSALGLQPGGENGAAGEIPHDYRPCKNRDVRKTGPGKIG